MDLAMKLLLAVLGAAAVAVKQHFDDKEAEESIKEMKKNEEIINAENKKNNDELNSGVSDARASELLSKDL
jgi:hypothetical protein